MRIFPRDKYRRYGSQRLEYRRFGTPTKEAPKEKSADEVFLGRRMFIFKGIAASCLAAIAGRIGYLQVFHHDFASTEAVTQNLRKQVVKAPRGLITDRYGQTLAENRKDWGLALIRSKLPKLPDGKPDVARREAMFAEIEKYVQLDWAITVKPLNAPEWASTVKPLGPKGIPPLAAQIAERLAPISTVYDAPNLARALQRTNPDPILLAKEYTKAEIGPFRQSIGDIPGVEFMRYAEYLVSPYNQPDANRPTLVTRGMDRIVALALDANVVDFPGMVVDQTLLTRHYPANDLVSHVIGYVGPVTAEELGKDPVTGEPIYQNDDVIGRMGLEAALEKELRGTPGMRYYLVDSEEVDRGTFQEQQAKAGANLELTLDLGLQRAVRDALLKQLPLAQEDARKANPDAVVQSAVAIALDPRNGEVLAMVSLPAYDNQVFIDGKDRAKINSYIHDNVAKPMLNKALYEVYPPGSTLKPFMAAAGLQDGSLKPETTYTCPPDGSIWVASYNGQRDQKPCWVVSHHMQAHGPQTVVDAIMNSCDIFFYNVGAPHQIDPTTDQYVHYFEYSPAGVVRREFQGLGIDKMDQYFADFGFGAETGMMDLAGEEAGVVPSQDYKRALTKKQYPPNGDPWSLGDTINVTIGQGYFTCTPLQMACATAAIANGGTFYRPHLVRRVVDASGAVLRTADTTPLRKSIIQPAHFALVRQGMRKVVTDGTAKGHINVPVPVAGKTGTAEFGAPIQIQGRPDLYQRQHAWFTAFAPYDNPEIAVAVLIVGGGEGSTFAAPAANDILNAWYSRKMNPTP